MAESKEFSRARYMESFESRHSDHSFTARLGAAAGITAAPLRLDSQAKYGSPHPPSAPTPADTTPQHPEPLHIGSLIPTLHSHAEWILAGAGSSPVPGRVECCAFL